MAELIVTDASHVDQASLEDFTLDAAWGADENDFELTVDRLIDAGSYVYFDGGECGGVVDSLKDSLKDGRSTLTYGGRTWHGMLANKILEPDKGKDYLTVSGTASTVIGSLISRVGLDGVFDAVDSPTAGAQTIKSYRFDRYTDCYTGLRRMCEANGLKLRLAYASGRVNIWAEPVAHYGDSIDSDLIDFDATRTWRKPNHLIGLGKGDLAARVVVHWYADAKGTVSQTQSLRGVDEITQVYDYSSAETAELNQKTREKLQDLQSEGDVRVTVRDDANVVFDVGDTVTARDNLTGITVNASGTTSSCSYASLLCIQMHSHQSVTFQLINSLRSCFNSSSISSTRLVSSEFSRCNTVISSRTGSGRSVWFMVSWGRLALLRFTTRPGTPTTVDPGGTSLKTTLPAPIFELSPMVKDPRTFAPALIMTLLPMVG